MTEEWAGIRLVKLKPATKRLTQVVKEHGQPWAVLSEKRVQCFKMAPAVFICPLHLLNTDDFSATRWVRLDHVEEVTHGEA